MSKNKPIKTAYEKSKENIIKIDIYDNGDKWEVRGKSINYGDLSLKSHLQIVSKDTEWVKEYFDYTEKGLSKEFNACLKGVRK